MTIADVDAVNDRQAPRRGSYSIRNFEPDDAPSLCALFETSGYGPTRDQDGYRIEPDDLVRGLTEMAAFDTLVGVAEGGDIVGFTTLLPASVHQATRGNGVFGSHLLIDPRYRKTGLAAGLVVNLGLLAFQRGYDRMDVVVHVSNSQAERIYRRYGMQRVTDDPDEDMRHTFTNYMPLVVRYLMTTFSASNELQLNWIAGGQALFKLLRGTTKRSNEVDTRSWRDTDVLSYELRLPSGEQLMLLVDRETDQVASVTGSRYDFACWPEGDRHLHSGEGATIHFQAGNRGEEPVTALVTEKAEGTVLFEGQLDPGQTEHGRLVVPVSMPGRHVVELVLQIGQVDAPEERFRTYGATTWVDVAGQQADAGGGFARDNQGWVARGDVARFRVSRDTGELLVARGEVVAAKEPWPDVGPPFPSSYKRQVDRRLEDLTGNDAAGLDLRSSANRWIELHGELAERTPVNGIEQLLVRRWLSVLAGDVLRVDTEVELNGKASGGTRWLRTWPRVCLGQPEIVLPTDGRSGHPWSPPGPLPSHPAHFEFLRPMLPETTGPTEPWAAFVDDGLVAGLVFPGASEARFGGRWMPSVLYEIPPLSRATPSYRLPPYLLVVARGGPERVAEAWHQLRTEMTPQVIIGP